MSDAVNHAEVIRQGIYQGALDGPCCDAALASLAAMQKELEEAKKEAAYQKNRRQKFMLLVKGKIKARGQLLDVLESQAERIAALEAQGVIDRDEQGRLREELRQMTESKDYAVSEATRHFDTVLDQNQRIAKLEEALDKATDLLAMAGCEPLDEFRALTAALSQSPKHPTP